MIAPDKLVIAMLEQLREQLVANDAPWQAILGRMGWSEAELNDAMADFREKKPAIKQGFPRRDDPWPVWCVFLGGEDTNTDFLSKFGSDRIEDDDAVDTLSSLTDQAVNIGVWTQNMDRTREHCELIMAAMMLMIPQDLVAHVFQNQLDVQYDVTYYPSNLWVRQQTWSFMVERLVDTTRADKPILDPVNVFIACAGHEAGDWDDEVVMGEVEEYE